MKKIRMMILGYGQRGRIYGDYALRFPDEFEVVSVADTDAERRAAAKSLFGCPVYAECEEMLKAGIKADLVAVATQDVDHERHAVACMAAGYDLLLEKPISNTIAGCRAICAAAEQYGARAIVCHVLRYTPFYRKIKEILDSGRLGKGLRGRPGPTGARVSLFQSEVWGKLQLYGGNIAGKSDKIVAFS